MASSSSNQRSLAAKEKQTFARATLTSSSSPSSSSWSHSTAMQSKSVNGPPLQTSNRPKVPAKRSVTPNHRDHFNVDNDLIVRAKSPKRSSSNHSSKPHDQEPGRVRVAVRLRTRHVEDADYADCVELQPEMKKLKLRKNNWSSESFKFDEVFSETASQKRVYQVVAKPVVESVLSGFNGTVMAYGQTGTGKTYTVGNLGKNDASERGIMVRALEDIMANISANDAVEVTYLQLYMESIHDLLSPNKVNIPIVEDSKTGEVSFPGAELVKVRDLDHFMELLQKAELNRHAANTKMNTNSSRSHAILMIYVRRPAIGAADIDFPSHELSKSVDGPGIAGVYTVRKSKLLIVDLAGSERIDKSGSEGQLLEEAKFINLSLTSLGKCINALAENSLHIPTRESKLTRILRDSFGGSARTSLIITVGSSERYHAETTSTIMFGQRAMKIVNMVKLKEEFDYESLSKTLEIQVDHLTREIDRQQKLRDNYINQMEKKLTECQLSFAEAERSLVTRSEILKKENSCLEKEIKSILSELSDQKNFNKLLSNEVSRLEFSFGQCKREREDEISKLREKLEENDQKKQNEINELQTKLAAILQSSENTKNELGSLREDYNNMSLEKEKVFGELDAVKQRLSIEVKHRAMFENDLKMLKVLPENVADVEDKKLHMRQHLSRGSSSFRTTMGLHRSISGQRVTIAEFCEEVGLEKIVSLLSSEDVELQMQAAKVVANLAAEDADQEKIVNEGGLDALLMLLQSSDSIPILRAASGAIANLAMNETNQGLIMSKGGAKVLTNTATRADDLPTLRMIAGAFANLCGNVKLHRVLQREGCIKALLGMAESGNTEIIAQVARGFANFAKSETRQVNQGHGKGPSLLIKADVLIWLINNTNTSSDSTRRHIELALCHLAQNDENARDLVSTGGLTAVIRMSSESSREDIRNLAKKTLKLNPIFQAQLREQR